MGQRSEEQITTDIEGTRRDLSRDLDALNDRVSPHRMMERRKAATRSKLYSMKERVMGSAHQARHSASSVGGTMGDTASSAAGSVTSTAQSAAHTVEQRTEGNPLAAGLIAFGAGWLVSSLIPTSRAEEQAAQRVVDTAKEHGQPVMDEAKSVGQQVGQDLKEKATEAAQEVKSSAQESAQHVRDEGQTSAEHVKDDAQNRM